LLGDLLNQMEKREPPLDNLSRVDYLNRHQALLSHLRKLGEIHPAAEWPIPLADQWREQLELMEWWIANLQHLQRPDPGVDRDRIRLRSDYAAPVLLEARCKIRRYHSGQPGLPVKPKRRSS